MSSSFVTNTSTPLANASEGSSGHQSPDQTKTAHPGRDGKRRRRRWCATAAIGGRRRHPCRSRAVVIAEIEFVDLDLVAIANREGVERVRVPMGHHLHALDHVRDAVLQRPGPDGPWTRNGFQRPIHGAKA